MNILRVELRTLNAHLTAFVARSPSTLVWSWWTWSEGCRIESSVATEKEALRDAEAWLRAKALRLAEMWTAVAKAEVTR